MVRAFDGYYEWPYRDDLLQWRIASLIALSWPKSLSLALALPARRGASFASSSVAFPLETHLTIFRYKGTKNLNEIHLCCFLHLPKDGSLSLVSVILIMAPLAPAVVTVLPWPPRRLKGEEFCDTDPGRVVGGCCLLVAAEATILCDESSESDRGSTGCCLLLPAWPACWLARCRGRSRPSRNIWSATAIASVCSDTDSRKSKLHCDGDDDDAGSAVMEEAVMSPWTMRSSGWGSGLLVGQLYEKLPTSGRRAHGVV